MLKIQDGNLEQFYSDIKGKKLILYGAGEKATFLYYNWKLQGKIHVFMDKEKRGYMDFTEEKIPILKIRDHLSMFKNKEEVVLLITPSFQAMNIIEELDAYKELDDVKCYVSNLIQDFYEKKEFSFTRGKELIPRKIHYCWFGNNEIPDKLKYCIDSWYQHCPNYEIICWNEDNYDIYANDYMKEAYEHQKWGFVSDYARLDIVYREGGVYLDTDVELIKPLDSLLCDEMFFGMGAMYRSGFGLGFGAIKYHGLIKKLRDYYSDKHFIDGNGKMILNPCCDYQDPVLKEFGFTLKNEYQKLGNVVCYPSEILNPIGNQDEYGNFSEKTISIHHASLTWRDENDRKAFLEYREKIAARLLEGKDINYVG